MFEWTINKAFEFIDKFGGKAYSAALEADRFGLNPYDVAEAVNNGANEGQALLGQAVMEHGADTFDFGWQSSAEMNGMLDDLDGVQGNHNPSEDGYSARDEILSAAFESGNDVKLVGNLNDDGTVTQTVEFDFGA